MLRKNLIHRNCTANVTKVNNRFYDNKINAVAGTVYLTSNNVRREIALCLETMLTSRSTESFWMHIRRVVNWECPLASLSKVIAISQKHNAADAAVTNSYHLIARKVLCTYLEWPTRKHYFPITSMLADDVHYYSSSHLMLDSIPLAVTPCAQSRPANLLSAVGKKVKRPSFKLTVKAVEQSRGGLSGKRARNHGAKTAFVVVLMRVNSCQFGVSPCIQIKLLSLAPPWSLGDSLCWRWRGIVKWFVKGSMNKRMSYCRMCHGG